MLIFNYPTVSMMAFRLGNLNTSYVNLQPTKEVESYIHRYNLNTSYVNLQRLKAYNRDADLTKFKYILC